MLCVISLALGACSEIAGLDLDGYRARDAGPGGGASGSAGSTGGSSPVGGTGGAAASGGSGGQPQCAGQSADCDGNPANGCETDIFTDIAACGGCGKACSIVHATPTCKDGTCTLACSSGYADCDNNPDTGCETDLSSSSTSCGECSKDCLGGACASGRCQPVAIASGQNNPWAIAIDASYVYWSNYGSGTSGQNDSTIIRSALDGSSPTQLGGGHSPIRSIALSSTDVFFVSEKGLFAVPKSGGTEKNYGGLTYPGAIAVDSTHVYVIEQGQSSNTGALERIPIGGGSFETLKGQVDFPSGIALSTDSVFWSSNDDKVLRTPKAGGASATIATAPANPEAFASDANGVWWITYGTCPLFSTCKLDGTVQSATLAGTGVAQLAGSLPNPVALAIDATHVYFVNEKGNDVRRVPKSGGAFETLVTNVKFPEGIAVDALAYYFTAADEGKVFRARK